MVTYSDPHLSSTTIGKDRYESKRHLFKDVKPILEIWKGGEGDPFQSIELNRDSRRYLHVRINNIVKTYDNITKEQTKTNNYYPL